MYALEDVGLQRKVSDIFNKWVKHAETTLLTFTVLLNLCYKCCQKVIPFFVTDNISVNFEMCMLPMLMKGSSAIQKKKNFTSQLGLMLVAVH